MQKKIIALAVAGLVSGVAFAQTNVTVYGAIDMAFEHRSDAINGTSGAYNAIDQGGWDDSWFGLKGTEDLGNGLTVAFQQEFGTRPDVNGAAVAQRPSFISLSGKNWGSVKAGNFFIDNVLFMTKGGFGNNGMSEKAIRVGMYTWAQNAVNYTSPNWSGVQFNLGYSSNMTFATDDNASQSKNNRAIFGDVTYSNGGLFVGASYMDFSNAASGGIFPTYGTAVAHGDNNDGNEWNIGASYDFKVANVGLVYNAYSVDDFADNAGADYDRDAWRLNVGVPITAKDEIYASYVNVDIDKHRAGVKDVDQDGFGIGYKHNLSKRTSLYAQAFWVDADDTVFISHDNDFGATLQEGYKFGIRHTF